jgi:hypothetical protein
MYIHSIKKKYYKRKLSKELLLKLHYSCFFFLYVRSNTPNLNFRSNRLMIKILIYHGKSFRTRDPLIADNVIFSLYYLMQAQASCVIIHYLGRISFLKTILGLILHSIPINPCLLASKFLIEILKNAFPIPVVRYNKKSISLAPFIKRKYPLIKKKKKKKKMNHGSVVVVDIRVAHFYWMPVVAYCVHHHETRDKNPSDHTITSISRAVHNSILVFLGKYLGQKVLILL